MLEPSPPIRAAREQQRSRGAVEESADRCSRSFSRRLRWPRVFAPALRSVLRSGGDRADTKGASFETRRWGPGGLEGRSR
ncbi:hypothetical protein MHYP_G00352190 [Metynnis hypsauchen]